MPLLLTGGSVPQHTAKGEAAHQQKFLTNYKKGKTTQPGPLRTTELPDLDAFLCLLHDNALLHTTEKTTKLLKKFGWENIDHPPYSPELAPSDFHLFPKMKKVWGSANGW
jgi:hypothetical protein